MTVEIITHPAEPGGLAARLLSRDPALGAWYPELPRGAAEWGAALEHAASGNADWLEQVGPAFGDGGAHGAAATRLARSAGGRGAVITTGQQPGMFGGPLYTLHKALSALALANALERDTGIAVAPVFWAATDDSDFEEARSTWVVSHGRLRELRLAEPPELGLPMARTPLADTDALADELAAACGSAANSDVLAAARAAYAPGATVGSAYVQLLRDVLEPLGIAVLDAAHPAVRRAAGSVLRRALTGADRVNEELRARDAELRAAGMRPQVALVPGLTLVFQRDAAGVRARVPVRDAAAVAERTDAVLTPNVLLRPVVERAILPTAAYVAGPGELRYFAQVSAVAEALGAATPRAVPRWSGTIVEPNVREALASIGATVADLDDPHRLEGDVARRELPAEVRDALAVLRASTARELAVVAQAASSPALARSTGGARARIEQRIDRLERRFVAAAKHAGSAALAAVALARASLRPNGAPQERVLNFVPFLARYGELVTDGVRAAAAVHAADVIGA